MNLKKEKTEEVLIEKNKEAKYDFVVVKEYSKDLSKDSGKFSTKTSQNNSNSINEANDQLDKDLVKLPNENINEYKQADEKEAIKETVKDFRNFNKDKIVINKTEGLKLAFYLFWHLFYKISYSFNNYF